MINLLKKYKSNIIFILISLMIFILFVLSFILPFIPKEKEEEKIAVEPTIDKEEKTNTILVDIKGQINKPGVYEMESDKRIIDVIKKAGGLTRNADTSMINLSQKVKDEMVIIIYSVREINEMKKEKEIECPKINDACVKNEDKASLIKEEKETVKTNSKVSINTATKEELMTLDGIGEAKALSIIDYRSKNGAFKTIEELKEVSGIGDSVFEKIKNKITI